MKAHYIDVNKFSLGPRMSVKFGSQIELVLEDVFSQPGTQKNWTITFLMPPIVSF